MHTKRPMCRNTRFIYIFRVSNMKISCQHISQTDNLWLLQLQWMFSTLSSAMSSDTELNHFQVLFFFRIWKWILFHFFFSEQMWSYLCMTRWNCYHLSHISAAMSQNSRFHFHCYTVSLRFLIWLECVVYYENYSISLINSKILTRLA